MFIYFQKHRFKSRKIKKKKKPFKVTSNKVLIHSNAYKINLIQVTCYHFISKKED